MSREIWKYIEGCDTCQRSKPSRQSSTVPLHPHDTLNKPWDVVSMDLIGPLPESQGKNAILVIIDRFSKQIHAIPTTVMLSAGETAKLLRDKIFHLQGISYTEYPRKSSTTEERSFSQSLPKNSIANWESRITHPQHITLRPMVKQKGSTRS